MSYRLKDNLTVPNFLSLCRFIMVPLIAYLYLTDHFVAALVTVIISGFTDMLDGFIARTFNCISDLGKILDPIADKLTLVTMVICLAIRHHVLLILLAFIVVKEVVLIVGAFFLFKKKTRPSESKIWGKCATCFTYVVIGLFIAGDILVQLKVAFVIPGLLLYSLITLTCVFLMLALSQYIKIYKSIISGEYSVETEDFVKDENKVTGEN